jgi:hypothetical protein
MELDAHRAGHRLDGLPRCVTGVEGVKYELHAQALVFTIQFRKGVLVANEHAASDAFEQEYGEMTAWAVVSEITTSPVSVTRAKHLVVPVHKHPAVTDDVHAVVGLVSACQAMRGSQDDPDPALLSRSEDPACG